LQRRLTKPLSICPTFEVLGDEPKEGVDSVGPGEGEDQGAGDHLVGLLAEVCSAESPPRRDVPMGALAAMACSLMPPVMQSPVVLGRGGRAQSKRRRLPAFLREPADEAPAKKWRKGGRKG
jgi:hypothetical protein